MKKSIRKYLEENGYTLESKKFSYWDCWYAIKNNIEIPLAVSGLIDNCGRSSYLVDISNFNINKFQRAFSILENFHQAPEEDRFSGNVYELIAYNSKLYVQDKYERHNF